MYLYFAPHNTSSGVAFCNVHAALVVGATDKSLCPNPPSLQDLPGIIVPVTLHTHRLQVAINKERNQGMLERPMMYFLT